MTVFNRLCLAVYSTLWILACMGLIALAWNTDQMLDLRAGDLNIQAFIDSTDDVRVAFTAMMLALALVGVVTFITAIIPQEPQGRMITVRGDRGAMTKVPVSSIEALLKRELESFNDIRSATVRVREQGGLISTDLYLAVAAGAHIADTEALASEVTQSVLQQRMGLATAQRPSVRATFDTTTVSIARTQAASPPPPSYTDNDEPLPAIQWDSAETRTYSRPRPTWRGETLLGPEDPPEPKWSPEPPVIDATFVELPPEEEAPRPPSRDTLFAEKEPGA